MRIYKNNLYLNFYIMKQRFFYLSLLISLFAFNSQAQEVKIIPTPSYSGHEIGIQTGTTNGVGLTYRYCA